MIQWYTIRENEDKNNFIRVKLFQHIDIGKQKSKQQWKFIKLKNLDNYDYFGLFQLG